MRILVAAPSDDYSLTNFVGEFRRMGHEVGHWDFTEDSLDVFADLVKKLKPDLLFHILVQDELPASVLDVLPCKKLLWSSDDNWRLPVSLSKVGAYTHATTNDPNAIPIYRAKGHQHVVHVQYAAASQWAPVPAEKTHDVTFIGQPYIGRPEFIQGLRDRGIDVFNPTERLDHAAMVRELCASKIVLGLNWVAGGPLMGHGPQVKGRCFEAAALGCFQIVTADRSLARYFAHGEIVTYADLDDCATKIRHFLDHPEEREAIAKAGQARVMRDHTWPERWKRSLPGLFGDRVKEGSIA